MGARATHAHAHAHPTHARTQIDTEGAEKQVLLQLRPWIAKYKPPIYLSM